MFRYVENIYLIFVFLFNSEMLIHVSRINFKRHIKLWTILPAVLYKYYIDDNILSVCLNDYVVVNDELALVYIFSFGRSIKEKKIEP